jgi:type II secretory ATPase GspE/PulE/Tfp pilus assembly ATPase PilB-like protein
MPTKKDTETIITPETPVVELSIKDEEQFHELVAAEKEKHAEKNEDKNTRELAEKLHALLKNQDSESALSLITRGALGLGSSDIHYDTSEHDVAIRLRIDGDLVTITELSR